MTDYFDEAGNKLEGYSPEEVEKMLEDERGRAIEETTADREAEITALNTKATENDTKILSLEKELETEKSKDKNLGGQRKIIEAKEDEIKTLREESEKFKIDIQQQIKEITTSSERKLIGDIISRIVDGDVEKAKLVKYHFDRFQGALPEKPEERDAEINKRIQDAYTLAIGGKPSINLTGSIISNVGSVPQVNPSQEKISPEVQEVAKNMTITDAELKKHKLI